MKEREKVKVGDKAKVYNRTLAGKVVEEGIVTIKGISQKGLAQLDSWFCEVQFDGESETYMRWILPENVIKKN